MLSPAPTRETTAMVPTGILGRFTNEIGTVVYGGVSLWAAVDLDEKVKLLVAIIAGLGTLACGIGTLLNGIAAFRNSRRARRPDPGKTNWRWK